MSVLLVKIQIRVSEPSIFGGEGLGVTYVIDL